MKRTKIPTYTLLLVHALIIGWFWQRGSWTDLTSGDAAAQLVAAGRLAGLVLASATLAQFLLMSRAPWLEQAFGLDKLARIHHRIGKYFLIPLLLHPLLITAGYASYSQLSYLRQYLAMLQYEDMLGAVVGFWLFLGIIVYSILQVWKRWNFERWYYVHLAMYLAIILSFGHQLELGGDFTASTLFSLYWYAAYAFAALHVGIFRFALPAYRTWKHQFTVSHITPETADTASVHITGTNLDQFHFTGGQFLFLRFLAKPFYTESHPFSISKNYDGHSVRHTIKGVGDFTRTIPQIPAGTKVLVEGPYGIFTAKRATGNKVLAIAGGIGITPFVAILEDLGKSGKDIVLIYGNKTEADIALRAELEHLAELYHFPIHHVISSQNTVVSSQLYNTPKQTADNRLLTTFHTGFVTPELITQLVPDAVEREVFLCGPPPMMNGLLKTLPALGIPKHKIYYEKFSL